MLSFKQFLREASLIEAAVTESWWYNPTKKDLVLVARNYYHDMEIVKSPEKFGYTEEQLKKLDPKINLDRPGNNSDHIPKISEPLMKKGWVKLRGETSGDLDIRADTLKHARAAASFWFKKYGPPKKRAFVDYEEGGREVSHRLDPVRFRFFVKTGTIPRESPLNKFR